MSGLPRSPMRLKGPFCPLLTPAFLFLERISLESSVFFSESISVENLIIPPHKSEWVQENWVRKAPGDVRVAATSRGYITKAKFHEYGLRFARYLKHQDLNDRPHMLIVDSHSSHLYNLYISLANLPALTQIQPVHHCTGFPRR